MKKRQNYNSFIDSIEIRYRNLRLIDLFKEKYNFYREKNKIVYKDKDSHLVVFHTRLHTDNLSNLKFEYETISFNGFKKYSKRDDLILKTFNEVIKLLNDNDIVFYLTSIDLSIDFYNSKVEDLIYTKSTRNTKKYLLSDLSTQSLSYITNGSTFNLEKLSKDLSKTSVRAIIYNKSLKEKSKNNTTIEDNIIRFEAKIKNFRDIEKGSVEKYNIALKEEIKKRLSKYIINHKEYGDIAFNYLILDYFLIKSNRF
jgi:hypothetical protein